MLWQKLIIVAHYLCIWSTVLHLLQWQRTFLFRSSSILSSILYISGKEGNVVKPDFPGDFHIKVPTTSLYLKICTHSFDILTKTLQGQWSLFKTGCANQLWSLKNWERKISNLLNWDSKSGCADTYPCTKGSTIPPLYVCIRGGRAGCSGCAFEHSIFGQ